MLNWDILNNNLYTYFSVNDKKRNSKQVAIYISNMYSNFIRSGVDVYGNTVISIDSNMLVLGIQTAMNMNFSLKTNKYYSYVPRFLTYAWRNAVMNKLVPPPGGLFVISNKIINGGSIVNFDIKTVGDAKYFADAYTNMFKQHINTISGIIQYNTATSPPITLQLNWFGVK